MKVLHLIPALGPHSGGVGTGPLAAARAQREAGIDASVWCADTRAVASRSAQDVEVMTFPVFGPRRFAFSCAAERCGRSVAADIVHQHGLWTAQGRITAVLRDRGLPTVVAPHGMLARVALDRAPWKKRAALAWFERRNLELASCLHATAADEQLAFREGSCSVKAILRARCRCRIKGNGCEVSS
ncbi:MAG: glycosyltransferase [Acidobacteria bacterium]|nr:glycosyltransferase [Acidobacteriota bacterium]